MDTTSPEQPASVARPEVTTAPATEAHDEAPRDNAPTLPPGTQTPSIRLTSIGGAITTRLANGSRALGSAVNAWRQRPPTVPAWVRSDRLQVLATAAVTSVLVSGLTLWMWGQGRVVSGSEVGAVTVSYELLDSGAGAADSVEPGEAFEKSEARPEDSPARVVAARQDGDVVPVTSGSTGVDRPARLVVITQPSGARVTINGVGWGTTPVTIPYPPPGTKRIRVTKTGYESEERVVGADGAPAGSTLRIQLRAAAKTRTRR